MIKKILFILVVLFSLVSCETEALQEPNELVGTNWTSTIWNSGVNGWVCVRCTIEFVSNTKALIVADHHRGSATVADSRTYTCNYTLDANYVDFNSINFTSNGVDFCFYGATYSATSMQVSGSMNGNTHSWTFKKQ